MTRTLMIAGLIVGLVGPGGRRAEAQFGAEEPARFTTPPINTEGLNELLPAPDSLDDQDEDPYVPGDIQEAKLTTVRGEGSERLRVDALMVIDTHARGPSGSLATALLKDSDNIANLFRSVGIQPTILQGNDARPDVIRRHYARLREGRIRPDVLIFYSSSHGFSNPRQASRGDRSHGHVLGFDNGRAPMWHANVRKAMLAVRPRRLAVILTDSCSSVRGGADYAGGSRELSPFAKGVLRSLLLEHTGLVDMNSSSLGQTSSCNDSRGSAFTYGLFNTIAYGSEAELDVAPRDGVVSWSEVFRSTRDLVSAGSNGRQVPEAFSLARPR